MEIKQPKHNVELLRFTTAGSVDDGKSTLIGRLLYDSKSIYQDQLDLVEEQSKNRGAEEIDLALLTDGLRSEREQGITIDVAYRYFSTPKRKFIIADTPGHIQYTRNMVTGASTANLALVLVDARHGIVEQTNRHSFLASLLYIPHLVVCINKMDLVDYSQEVFDKIVDDFRALSSKLDIRDIHFIPISALKGDNVVTRSETMDWYQGPSLFYLLENIHISSDENHIDGRFPVQYVVRPQTEDNPDYRGYAGQVASGIFKPGDDVAVLPSGFSSKIKSIDTYEGSIDRAFPYMATTMVLEDDIDVSRGDMIVRQNNQPKVSQDIEARICWMGETDMQLNGKYALMHTTNECRCIIKEIKYKVNINTLQRDEEDKKIGMNDIARIKIRTTVPLFFDSYRKNRITGSFILIDESTNNTVAACMIL
ncbi:MAG: sulfate adenylyltransferase subunit CysN [Bacteroidia bacterium]|nr:sulfate adenylyltransferase subunit CysN [Bacteroidia bacterium]